MSGDSGDEASTVPVYKPAGETELYSIKSFSYVKSQFVSRISGYRGKKAYDNSMCMDRDLDDWELNIFDEDSFLAVLDDPLPPLIFI